MKCVQRISYPSFRLHQLDGHIQSMYLVEYSDKLLLLDGGCKCDSGGIRDFISTVLNRDIRSLALCAVSHMHPDHAGGARSLRTHTGCLLAAPSDCDLWYRGLGGFFQHKIDTYLAWWVSRKKNRQKRRVLYPRTLQPDVLLKDGDSLPGFEDWLFLRTPGHTSHDGCFLHPETGLCYTGDLIVKIKGKFLPPFPVTLEDNMETSLRKIQETPTKTLLLAHGGLVDRAMEGLDFDSIIQKIKSRGRLRFRLLNLFTRLGREIRHAKSQKWDYH